MNNSGATFSSSLHTKIVSDALDDMFSLGEECGEITSRITHHGLTPEQIDFTRGLPARKAAILDRLMEQLALK